MTLACSLRYKEEDSANGLELDTHEHVRQLLHRLISATNRRMHKGFPEMLSYLMHRLQEYSSHLFVTLAFDRIYRLLLAILYRKLGTSTIASTSSSSRVLICPKMIHISTGQRRLPSHCREHLNCGKGIADSDPNYSICVLDIFFCCCV